MKCILRKLKWDKKGNLRGYDKKERMRLFIGREVIKEYHRATKGTDSVLNNIMQDTLCKGGKVKTNYISKKKHESKNSKIS